MKLRERLYFIAFYCPVSVCSDFINHFNISFFSFFFLEMFFSHFTLFALGNSHPKASCNSHLALPKQRQRRQEEKNQQKKDIEIPKNIYIFGDVMSTE